MVIFSIYSKSYAQSETDYFLSTDQTVVISGLEAKSNLSVSESTFGQMSSKKMVHHAFREDELGQLKAMAKGGECDSFQSPEPKAETNWSIYVNRCLSKHEQQTKFRFGYNRDHGVNQNQDHRALQATTKFRDILNLGTTRVVSRSIVGAFNNNKFLSAALVGKVEGSIDLTSSPTPIETAKKPSYVLVINNKAKTSREILVSSSTEMPMSAKNNARVTLVEEKKIVEIFESDSKEGEDSTTQIASKPKYKTWEHRNLGWTSSPFSSYRFVAQRITGNSGFQAGFSIEESNRIIQVQTQNVTNPGLDTTLVTYRIPMFANSISYESTLENKNSALKINLKKDESMEGSATHTFDTGAYQLTFVLRI